MKQAQSLRDLVAAMLMTTPDLIGPETSLRNLDNSLNSARLNLGLKRLGLALPRNIRPATFGVLESALMGSMTAEQAPLSVPSEVMLISSRSNDSNELQVGLDVQDIGGLPITTDYWEHSFYQGVFGMTEVAYALLQSDPRVHLAGFWCAKEALRKCDMAFRDVDMTTIVVAHDDRRKPHLLWHQPAGTTRLPHALSISHSGNLASAVVVHSGTRQSLASKPTSLEAAAVESGQTQYRPDAVQTRYRPDAYSAFVLGLIAGIAVISVWLLLRH